LPQATEPIVSNMSAVRPLLMAWAMGLSSACSSTILIEDGSGAKSSEGASSAYGGGAGEGGGQAGAAGSTGAWTFDAAAGCALACEGPCIGNEALCIENCVVRVFPHCEQEALDFQQCLSNQCPETVEGCTAKEEALYDCFNPFGCYSDLSDDCEDFGNSCSCSDVCNESHVALAQCTKTGDDKSICECTFDGQLMGTCIGGNVPYACSVSGGCCAGWFVEL
jgi:hypothetical protein